MEDLSSILSGEPSQQQATTEPVETQQEVANEGNEGTGEKTTPPVEPQKDDNLDKARKGLEAAAKAERERRQAAEARAEAAERRARELETREQSRQQPQQKQAEDPKPLRANFASEDEWLDARDAWRDRQRDAAAAAEKAQKEERDLYEKTEAAYAQAQALEGFDRAAFDRLPFTKPMVEALLESEFAPKLMHFMAANPAEVTRIAGLSTTRQIAELARIEARLETATPAETEEEDKPPKAKPQLPETLTQTRNAKGQYEPAYSGPTPLNAILATKK